MAWEADHSPPCRTEGKKWVEFDVHSAIHHGVNSWPLLHVVLRFRMSGVWHPLRHTPSWREKLTTHLHVVLRVKNEWSMTSTPPYTMAWTADHFSMSYWGLEWVEFDIYSAIHHGVNSWPLLHVVLRFRMSGDIYSAIHFHGVRRQRVFFRLQEHNGRC